MLFLSHKNPAYLQGCRTPLFFVTCYIINQFSGCDNAIYLSIFHDNMKFTSS